MIPEVTSHALKELDGKEGEEEDHEASVPDSASGNTKKTLQRSFMVGRVALRTVFFDTKLLDAVTSGPPAAIKQVQSVRHVSVSLKMRQLSCSWSPMMEMLQTTSETCLSQLDSAKVSTGCNACRWCFLVPAWTQGHGACRCLKEILQTTSKTCLSQLDSA